MLAMDDDDNALPAAIQHASAAIAGGAQKDTDNRAVCFCLSYLRLVSGYAVFNIWCIVGEAGSVAGLCENL